MKFRLIRYKAFDAATNMAIDEAILEAHMSGAVPPTLRFYNFLPAAISLGYAQKLDANLMRRIEESGFDLVRRPTGGRAVLHSGELTYSFVATSKHSGLTGTAKVPEADNNPDTAFGGLLDQSVSKAYKQVCQGLILGLQKLKLETSLGASSTNYKDVHDCFLAATGADLQANGMKLVGSAQLRRRHGVLQHGSILLNQEQNAMAEVFSPEVSASVDDKLAHHANLFELIGERSIEEIEAAIVCGFEEAFDAKLVDGTLTPEEISFAKVARERYLVKNENTSLAKL